jgi:glutamine cyclotransferase
MSQLNVWKESGGSFTPVAGICLPDAAFAEGAVLAEGTVSVLTWRENYVLRLSPELEMRDPIFFSGQGWGLTYDGDRLWRSDGSARLQAHDPLTFDAMGQAVAAADAGVPVERLNELEYDPSTGLVLANVYQTDRVAAIDPESGTVKFWLDFEGIAEPLRAQLMEPDSVLNGLAFDSEGRLWATGKMWDRVFEINYRLPEGGSRRPLPRRLAAAPPVFPDSLAGGCPTPVRP